MKNLITGKFISYLMPRFCEGCKQLFKPRTKYIKNCSRKCAGWPDTTLKLIFETGIGYVVKSTICKSCSKSFSFKARGIGKYSKRIFCSNECKWKYGTRTGIPLSEHSRNKLSKKYIGENNPVWRGGLSQGRNLIYRGRKYREWRDSIFQRDNYTCVLCMVRSGKLEADHIKPWAEFKDGWFDINNGRTLCVICHLKITKEYLSKNWKNQYVQP